MAKEAAAKNTDKPVTTPTPAAIPAGYKKAATDAVGFYDGDLNEPIHFVPLHVNLSDSKIDPSKPSALIMGRLVEPCKAVRTANAPEGTKPSEAPLIETKKDDVVGVWFSAGMRDLARLSGVPVYMVPNGTKPIKGKPSPMKVYDCHHPKPGNAMPVGEDRRRDSAGIEAKPFAGKKLAGADAAVDKGDAGDDDIPF